MRTTVTLDDDVQAKLQAEARRQGKSFKEMVNHYLRLGLMGRRSKGSSRHEFRIQARPLGLREGLSLTSVSRLIEELEGPLHR